MSSNILVIGDIQASPERPTKHLTALGNWIVEHKPDVLVNIGDTYDMPSLSSYDSGAKKAADKRCVWSDLEAGNTALNALCKPLRELQKRQKRNKKRPWKPRMVFTTGNHEHRINRFIDDNPEFDTLLNAHTLLLNEWEVYSFLQPVNIEGILFAHYFKNPGSKFPIGGTMQNRLNRIKESFVQGHEQGIKFDRVVTLNRTITGLVCGSFYMHDEDYMGPQGNKTHWRGCCFLENASNGDYELRELSLNYLLENYL